MLELKRALDVLKALPLHAESVYGYSRDDEDVTGKVPCSASVSFAVRERTQSSRHAGAHIIQWASSLHRLCMLGVVHPHTLSLHFLAPRLQILFLPSP